MDVNAVHLAFGDNLLYFIFPINVDAYNSEDFICCLAPPSGANITPNVQRAVDGGSHSMGAIILLAGLSNNMLPGARFSDKYSVVKRLKLYFGCI
jgi:hypothetical protein